MTHFIVQYKEAQRPQPENCIHIYPCLTNVIHFSCTLFLAVTVLLGVNVSSLDDGFRSSQTVVVAVWLAFIVLWEILLEILSCCAKSTAFFFVACSSSPFSQIANNAKSQSNFFTFSCSFQQKLCQK